MSKVSLSSQPTTGKQSGHNNCSICFLGLPVWPMYRLSFATNHSDQSLVRSSPAKATVHFIIKIRSTYRVPVLYLFQSVTAWSKQYSTVVVPSSLGLNSWHCMQCSGVNPSGCLADVMQHACCFN
jgi:hypothetical protein